MKTELLRLTAGLGLTLLTLIPLAKAEDADEGVFDQLAAVTGTAPAGAAAAKPEAGAGTGAATPGAGAGTTAAGTAAAGTGNLTTELQKQPGVEPQLKGPVHEAFAEPVTEPKPGPLVAKEPPKDLEELPAAQKPDGEDVQWYGGYWDFDQDRTDFVWVSGIYRKPPPRRQWTSGSWVKVEGGWQRQRGLWLTLDIGSITFLSSAPPPAPVEEAANTPPDNNSVFVPGNYVPQETSYVWKPGKWVPMQQNWIWIPAHYVWTPCGYVFVPGYWDYLMEKRGLCFAPVCVDFKYVTPGWVYTPCCVIHNTCMLDALFVRPGCGYFFGSYFQNPAYTCWPDFCVRGKVCDPMFSYYKLHHKGSWEHNLKALYNGRKDGSIASPPSNLRELGKFVQDFKSGKINANQVRHSLMVGSTGHLNANVLKLRNLDNNGVQNQKRFSDQLRDSGRTLGQKQTQFLSSRGSSNGNNQVFKLDVDKSVTARFRGNSNGNGNGGNGNGSGNNLGKILGQNGNTGINPRSNGGGGSDNKNKGPGSGTQIFNQNGNGNNGFTPRSNAGNGTDNKPKVLSGGNNTPKVLQGTGNNGFTPRSNQGSGSGNSGNGGGNGNGSNTIRRFDSGSGGGSFFQKSQGTGSGSGGSFFQKSQSSGSGSGSFSTPSTRSFSGGSGSGGGGNGGGSRGRR